jgi:hypothetical protein
VAVPIINLEPGPPLGVTRIDTQKKYTRPFHEPKRGFSACVKSKMKKKKLGVMKLACLLVCCLDRASTGEAGEIHAVQKNKVILYFTTLCNRASITTAIDF